MLVVIGPGAIGSLVAGRLAQAGEPVALLARQATAARLRVEGVWLGPPGALQRCNVPVISDRSELPADTTLRAILCVKGYDTEGALATLAALHPIEILTLQNGIGNEEALAAHFGNQRVVSGSITTSVEVETIGQAVITKEGGIGVAALPGGPSVEPWVSLLVRAGFRTASYSDYRAMKWSKALLNMFGNATAAILDMPVAAIVANPPLLAVERGVFSETLTVMARLGMQPVNLPRYPAALLASVVRYAPQALTNLILRRAVAGGRGGKPPSLHLDLARGNQRTEGQFLYGAVAETAAQHSIAVPLTAGLWRILSEIVSGAMPWEHFWHQPEVLLKGLGVGDQ
jgi:2-dehydropantoate 2-reductase